MYCRRNTITRQRKSFPRWLTKLLPYYVLSNEKDKQHPSLRRNTRIYRARRWWFISRIAIPCAALIVFLPAKWSIVAAFFLLFIGLSFLDEH